MITSRVTELSVRQLLARRRRLSGGLSDAERTLRGVLLSEGRRCSSEGCRCRRGELHGPYTYLAVYVDGRSRTIYVPAVSQEAAAAHVELTQRNEALLAEISQINLELLRRRALE
ncbi:MAG TPA: DUF6788 family protein [Myxococcota bacterium]|nr:DUF6788 family protein [Myxococcota bacterium]